jgi:hypothetical protein
LSHLIRKSYRWESILTVFPSHSVSFILWWTLKNRQDTFICVPLLSITAYSVNVLLGNTRIWETLKNVTPASLGTKIRVYMAHWVAIGPCRTNIDYNILHSWWLAYNFGIRMFAPSHVRPMPVRTKSQSFRTQLGLFRPIGSHLEWMHGARCNL